jgi:HlyD family secretion protein
MRATWLKWVLGLIVVGGIVAAVVYALMPRPIEVDVAAVERGPMEVTINEDGTAHIHDVFRVSAPIAGRLDRIPVHVGDRVYANNIVASIHPTEPGFLDLRTRREFEAAVDAAKAAVALAQARVNAALSAQRMAAADLARAEQLSGAGTITLRAYEQARSNLDTAEAQVDQANAELALRKSELASAEARLIEPDQPVMTPQPAGCCLSVRAPVGGMVISLISESEQVVAAGTPLLEIGNPRELEVLVPLLSADAAAMTIGTPAVIDGWGGPPLDAKVSMIAPAAYTKVSALGIEEQRVDVTLSIDNPYEERQRLGHGFRVEVRVVIWRADDVTRVPLSALFRRGSEWAVFRVVDGRAVETMIRIDHRNAQFAEVLDGLTAGDTVVVHPSDQVTDGTRIAARE